MHMDGWQASTLLTLIYKFPQYCNIYYNYTNQFDFLNSDRTIFGAFEYNITVIHVVIVSTFCIVNIQVLGTI